jgi:2-dehydro-3-deoxyphosphogluconate aldolase/(4S)-4-hydroxy-2-oxoglutarate aldolase
MPVIERIRQKPIVPVIALEDASDAIDLCRALKAGGLEVAEITFRTDAAREAIATVAGEFPEFALGAGTVTTEDEAEAAKEAGAQFAVAPGLNPSVVKKAQEIGLEFYPGVCTPSDIEGALALGCTVLKYFPAEAMGGLKLLKALYGPYRHRGIEFIPTGGINGENMDDYLRQPGVAAVGGSWLVDKKLLADKRWDRVTALTEAAVKRAAHFWNG